MGLTAVQNDTLEKKKYRDRLLALLDNASFTLSPEVWADNGFATIMTVAQFAVGDDVRLADMCSTEQMRVSADDVDDWAADMEMPNQERQAEIVKLILAGLKRIESAIDHD